MTRVASGDGTQIAFTKAGNGPALVIVSGALSHRALIGDTLLVPKLAERFSVYTYDRRGRGESGDTKPYSVDREIEDLAPARSSTARAACLTAARDTPCSRSATFRPT